MNNANNSLLCLIFCRLCFLQLLFAFFSNEKCKMTGVIRFRPSSSSSSKGGIFFALLSFYFFPLLLRQVLEVEIFINSEFIREKKSQRQVLSDWVKNGTCDISFFFSPLIVRTNFTSLYPQTSLPLFVQ